MGVEEERMIKSEIRLRLADGEEITWFLYILYQKVIVFYCLKKCEFLLILL